MWNFYLSEIKKTSHFDKDASFYCGDAAGRKAPVKDFSDTDLYSFF